MAPTTDPANAPTPAPAPAPAAGVDDDPATLAQAVDAALDEVAQTLADGGTVDEIVPLVVAAQATVDALLVALAAADVDDTPDAAPAAPVTPSVGAAKDFCFRVGENLRDSALDWQGVADLASLIAVDVAESTLAGRLPGVYDDINKASNAAANAAINFVGGQYRQAYEAVAPAPVAALAAPQAALKRVHRDADGNIIAIEEIPSFVEAD